MCKGPGAGRSRGYLRKNFKEANLSVLKQGEGKNGARPYRALGHVKQCGF